MVIGRQPSLARRAGGADLWSSGDCVAQGRLGLRPRRCAAGAWGYPSTVSAGPGAESQSHPAQGTEMLTAVNARLAELAPEIRRINRSPRA